jgi:hypothetical protein
MYELLDAKPSSKIPLQFTKNQSSKFLNQFKNMEKCGVRQKKEKKKEKVREKEKEKMKEQ